MTTFAASAAASVASATALAPSCFTTARHGHAAAKSS